MSSVPSGTPAPGLDHEAALLGALLQRPALVLRLPTRAEHYERPIHAVVHRTQPRGPADTAGIDPFSVRRAPMTGAPAAVSLTETPPSRRGSSVVPSPAEGTDG